MGKMPTDSLGKSSELKLHCFCLFDAYSMPKDMCSVYYRPQLYNTYETRLMSQEASMPQLPLQSVIYCPAPPLHL